MEKIILFLLGIIRAGQADPKLYETYEPVERVVEIECNN